MTQAFVIGLLGAEGTGRTTLARDLQAVLADGPTRVAVVTDPLREFCDHRRRAPRADELAPIAHGQTRRIAAAAACHDIVVADTTALMLAVYRDQVLGDTGLYDPALGGHARCDLTLLTALDLPWRADGLPDDAPRPSREVVDARLRAALRAASAPFSVVTGSGEQRLINALRAVRRSRANPGDAGDDAMRRPWSWACERCGDAACERHLLPSRAGR